MLNIADIVAIVIVLIAIYRGYKKGFVKTGFGFLSFFLAIAITFMFYKPVMGIIKEKTGFEQWLTEYLSNIDFSKKDKTELEENNSETTETVEGENYLANLPENIINLLGIDEMRENAEKAMIQAIVDFVVKLLAIIIVYIVAKIILSIILLILDSIASLPVLKQFNEVLGLILGGILGMMQVYMICAILALISSLPMANEVNSVINSSLFAHTLYDNNLLLRILFG